MMAELKISGKLPNGDGNGLARIVADLVENPRKVHALLVLVDCKQVVTDQDTGDTVPTARIRRAEVVRRQDLKEAERLVRRALEERSGTTVLPMELEDEITAAFADIDPRTGEAKDE
jgi:hypothetical protein